MRARAGFALAAALVAASCVVDLRPTDESQDAECRCRDRRSGACIFVRACETDRNCPSGTRCATVASAPPQGCYADCTGPSEVQTSCVLAEADSNALIGGFDVDPFSATPVEGISTLSYTLTPPTGVGRVACALFGCDPDIRVGEDERRYMANFERCALWKNLDVDPSTPVTPAPSGKAACTKPKEACYGVAGQSDGGAPIGSRVCEPVKLTTLSFACWAYDEVNLVAATLLIPYPVAALDPDVAKRLVADCSVASEHEGWSCVPADGTSPTGTCRGGRCLHRCFTAADCVSGPSEKSCPVFECDHGDSSSGHGAYLGVCRESCDSGE